MPGRGLFLIFLLLFLKTSGTALIAQTEVDERAMIRFDKGLGFHSPDSSFGLNLRFRMQNRLGISGLSGGDPVIENIDARIRRLRLRFDGYTKNDRITYYLQLSFSRSDQDWDNSGVPNIVRDAMVYYAFSEKFYAGFGQGKLPGNRQRINSSGQLQFPDRSDVNARFNIDRDFGIFGYYSNNISFLHYNFKTSISSGEGRNALTSDRGLAYTARLELMPLGRFINDGDFSEGDIEREPTPKLSLAGGYHFNHKAVRTQGQRGTPLFEPRDIRTVHFDAVIKYRGWAAYAEYMDRFTDNPVTYTPEGDISNVHTGYGINMQISYLFINYIELAGRYTCVNPERVLFHPPADHDFDDNLILTGDPDTKEYTLGITKYLVKHKIKAQGNIGYKKTGAPASATETINRWFIQFQVELGI